MTGNTDDLVAEASRTQRRAANPEASVWVAASAGSGKTKVLVDRVLSLLLAGTKPSRILCLTFTRAAAAEMALRISEMLGGWASEPDEQVRKNLLDLTGGSATDTQLRMARRLFADVLDAPGGMKIMTIHAFCASVLARFPLEAGIAPHFQELDERTAAEALAGARDRMLQRAGPVKETAPDRDLAAALDHVSGYGDETAFAKLISGIIGNRGRLTQLQEHHGGWDALISAACLALGVDEGGSVENIIADACNDACVDITGLRRAAAALVEGSPTDQKRGEQIAAWVNNTAERSSFFDAYRAVFLVKEGAPRKTLATKKVVAKHPDTLDVLQREADRLAAVELARRARKIADATRAMLVIAREMLAEYQAHKQKHAELDYDDLILFTRGLLEGEGAAKWVLFKLDGGLDHILIDEAQDTSPDQWRVVLALADEFFAGLGAHDDQRTMFAVGDAKQSIYSFQGADPDSFDLMRAYFEERVRAAERLWETVGLAISFRSTPSVLKAVDAVFAGDIAGEGLGAEAGNIQHQPKRAMSAGLVEFWPAVSPVSDDPGQAAAPDEKDDRPARKNQPEPWVLPVAPKPVDSPQTRVANVVAGRIKRMLTDNEMLESTNRPIRPGDIMVLVRRRTPFVTSLVRALKQHRVPVAGVDRMVLADQLVVQDLIALGQFLLLPEDDLTLATVLKGPLFNFSEEQLFDIAFGRTGTLWASLRHHEAADDIYRRTIQELTKLLGEVDFTPPFEFYSRLLGARGGRRRLIARLGTDADDPIDEFLSLALAFERLHPPSLQAFLHWLVRGDTNIKRDLDQALRNEVRVMTVHGAKGLQAPIVFLPDTLQTPGNLRNLFWLARGAGPARQDAAFFWVPKPDLHVGVTDTLRNNAKLDEEHEYHRLLYVAMTRAADRLYVTGWRNKKTAPAGNWYDLIDTGLEGCEHAEKTTFDLTDYAPDGWTGDGWRMENPQTGELEKKEEQDEQAALPDALPVWAEVPPDPEAVVRRHISPSHISGDGDEEDRENAEPAAISPSAGGSSLSYQRGLIVHRLLQLLPDIDPAARPAAAAGYLARPVHGLGPDDQQTLVEEVLAVLNHPEFAPIFGPGSHAEVPLAGQVGDVVISGQVDRLLLTDDTVLVIDYKTNRPPPVEASGIAPVYLRQLAAYRAVLRQIYPGKPVSAALLWTAVPLLMPVDDALLDRFGISVAP